MCQKLYRHISCVKHSTRRAAKIGATKIVCARGYCHRVTSLVDRQRCLQQKKEKKKRIHSLLCIQCRRWLRNRVTLLIIYWDTDAYGLVALITVAMQHRDLHFFCHILKNLCAHSMDKQGKSKAR